MASEAPIAGSPLGVSNPLAGGQAAEETRFSWADPVQRNSFFAVIGLTVLLTYSFWTTLELTSKFWNDAQYSHGYLIPLIALWLAWTRRPNPAAQEPGEDGQEETFMGFVPASMFRNIAAGAGVALGGAGYFMGSELLQGMGLAVASIGLLAYVLIGQPFANVTSVERYVGLATILVAYAARILIAAEFEMAPIDRLCFLIAMLGAFVMVGGWRLLGWAGPGVGFLFFMFPLPTAIQIPVLGGLQKLAAYVSEVILTILGQPVFREGNKIIVDGIPLEVAEACSGLRMVTIFGAMAVAMMLIIRERPWWDRFIILLSAVPIALISNIARIVTTALLYRAFPEGEVIHQLIHDYAGIAMMPFAMGLLYLELTVLKMLTVEEESLDLSHGGVGAGGMGAAPVAR